MAVMAAVMRKEMASGVDMDMPAILKLLDE